METPKFVSETIHTTLNVARFILDRLSGGGWADLNPEQQAAIHYYPEPVESTAEKKKAA